jgi:putative ABC transport system permease protein
MFFYVLTIQTVPQIGILKALGASSWFVFGQLVLQVLALTVAGLVVAILLALLTRAALPEGGIPLAFPRSTFVVTVVGLLVSSVLGSLVSGRRVAKLDPIIALGQQQ